MNRSALNNCQHIHTRDPDRVVLVHTLDTRWRNRAELPAGRDEAHQFLTRKWARELESPRGETMTYLASTRTRPAIARNAAQNAIASPVSAGWGEKIRMNPRSFTSAEKLETQNGMQNILNRCQRSKRIACGPDKLSMRAHPMIRLSPAEVSQRLGAGSKYAAAITRYQIR